MKRLTTNKNVIDMGMAELAHNACYAGRNREARYRDYSLDTDARELARKLLVDYADGDDAFTSDEDFDSCMVEYLQEGTESMEGLIALFYRNLWAMADLYEKLKYYEDLEEQGGLIELPCRVGDTVYVYSRMRPFIDMDFEEAKEELLYLEAKVVSYRKNSNGSYIKLKVRAKWLYEWIDPDCGADSGYFEREKYFTYPLSAIGKTIFLTREEAEKALEGMRNHG